MTEVFTSSNRQYTDGFKTEAVKQVVERGFTVVDVATRIGVPRHTLYGWVQSARKTMGSPAGAVTTTCDPAEVRRLKAGSTPFLRTLTRRPTLAKRNVLLEVTAVQPAAHAERPA